MRSTKLRRSLELRFQVGRSLKDKTTSIVSTKILLHPRTIPEPSATNQTNVVEVHSPVLRKPENPY